MADIKVPTKEKILEVSKICGDVKKMMQILYPEAFEDEWEDVTQSVKIRLGGGNSKYIEISHNNYTFALLSFGGKIYVKNNNYKFEKIDNCEYVPEYKVFKRGG